MCGRRLEKEVGSWVGVKQFRFAEDGPRWLDASLLYWSAFAFEELLIPCRRCHVLMNGCRLWFLPCFLSGRFGRRRH